MGMTIDEAIKQLETYTIPCGKYKAAYDLAIETMRKYQMMQADYETRLKADLKAMLTEIQLEIEESENCGKAFHLGLQMASNIIQQKINELKGVEDGNVD